MSTTTRTVSFETQGSPLSGTIYLPETTQGPLATVVVTGAWTSVQEQMPRAYAQALTAHGLAAFTFDFRGWGKSGDLPGAVRYKEDPAAKTADIRAAIACVAQQPEVDARRIHGLGICASAGYMIDAVAGNPQVQRLGLIAPWLQNKALVESVYGGAEGVAALIALSRQAEASGDQIIPAAGPIGAEGVLMPLGGYYYEPDRGAVPEYDNRWNVASWEGWLSYHPADNAARLDKPLATVHSDAAAIPDGLRAFLKGYDGPLTERWFENVEQFDFYDGAENIRRATEVVAAHFMAAPGH